MVSLCGSCREREPLVHWTCKTEQIEIQLCEECMDDWRAQRKLDPSLGIMCPRCVVNRRQAAIERARVKEWQAMPLLADVSDEVLGAVETAMAAEGILLDIRDRVLSRLIHGDPNTRHTMRRVA